MQNSESSRVASKVDCAAADAGESVREMDRQKLGVFLAMLAEKGSGQQRARGHRCSSDERCPSGPHLYSMGIVKRVNIKLHQRARRKERARPPKKIGGRARFETLVRAC